MNGRLRNWPWIEIGIILLAVVLRLALLDIKPPHFDEGVNGWFADQMTRTGYYNYDPTNYHGPLHFYAVWLSQTFFGRNLWALRLPAILASVLCVWMMLRHRPFLGVAASRLGALAMAISPGFVFYGRYSIHESWQVLFSLLLLWGVLGLWQSGSRRALFAVVGGITGMILTKETYILHIGSLALAGGTLWLWSKVVPSQPGLPISPARWTRADLGSSIGVGVAAIVAFYSGFFLNFPALHGLYETFAAWAHTGIEAAGHEKTTYQIGPLNYYWLALLARYELPALAGFLFCFVLAGRMPAMLRLIAIYACGVLLAYSIIKYKTPWCIISIEWPFLLLFGSACAWGARMAKLPTLLIAAALLLVSFAQMIRLNFVNFVDEKEPYVYVQTYTEVALLIDPILKLTARDPRQIQMRGQILLDSYYPLPWMLGDYPYVGYFGEDNQPEHHDADFIVVDKEKSRTVEEKLPEPYFKRTFHLRDSQEESVVYFKKSRFEEYFRGENLPVVGAMP